MLENRILVSELFPAEPSKAQKRQIQIVEAAIENYATLGLDRTTYQTIAKTSGVSRALVQHYFPDKESLFRMTVRYIRANFQHMAVTSMKTDLDPIQQLESYINSTFIWIKRYRSHVVTWTHFFYKAAVDKEYRKLNSQFVEMGHHRLIALIERGVEMGVFTSDNISRDAKTIQLIITATLMREITENAPHGLRDNREETHEACFRLLGVGRSLANLPH